MDVTPRQAEFADAALRVLAREGMTSVSFRTVAAEAGMSLGAVQKAFPTKDAHAARDVRAAPRHSVHARRWSNPVDPPSAPGSVDLMVSVLPLDRPRRAAELQGAAFAERAAFDPGSAAAVAASDHELRARSHDWCVGPTPRARCRNRWTLTPRRGPCWRSCRAWPANCCTTLPPRTPSDANAGGSSTRCYATDASPMPRKKTTK